MVIIGLSAKKQGGKSTLVDYLITQLPQCEVIRFADSLKQIVLDCFVPSKLGYVVPDDLESDEAKNTALPCGKTIREMLQLVGTDWFRGAWEDCWINTFRKRVIKSNAAFILIPDVRFPNELKIIQEMGGKVIRLMRAPFGDQDQHESETALDENERLSLSSSKLFNEDTWVLQMGLKGTHFNLVYDNREKTLADAEIWAKNLVDKCFSWGGNSEGITNPGLDLIKLGE